MSHSYLGQERNDCLMSVHTSVESGDVQSKISVSGREIRSSLMEDNITMTRNSAKSRMSKFSLGGLKVHMRSLGTCIARYSPINSIATVF